MKCDTCENMIRFDGDDLCLLRATCFEKEALRGSDEEEAYAVYAYSENLEIADGTHCETEWLGVLHEI